MSEARPKLSPFDPAALRVFDAMPEPVWLAYPDGSIAFVNEQLCELLGITRERVLADGWQHLLHPDERDDVFRGVAHTLRTGEPFEFEGRMLSGSGSFIWIRSRAKALRDDDGDIAGFVGHLIDIDAYKAAELQARAAEAALRDAVDFNQTLLDTMPIMFWVADENGVAHHFNRWFYEYTGLTPDDTRDGRYWTVMHPEDRAGAGERWRTLRSEGRPADRFARYRRGSDGAYRWHLVHARPQRDASGTIVRWLGFNLDVHDQRRAAERTQFLLHATGALAAAPDRAQLFAMLAELCVPALADDAVVLGEDGQIAAAHGVDATTAAALRDRFAAEGGEVGDDETTVTALYRGREPAGALITRFGASGRRYDDDDRQALQLLSGRLAGVLEQAHRFEREHRVAETLQRASLPRHLPSPPSLRLYAYYAAGRSEASIGGDWYDAFELRDGRIVLSVGDVAGRGLDAAVTMANMRQILRGIGHVHADPALMLQAADRALRGEHPDRYVTALACVVDPIDETLSYAIAGHPPGVLRRAHGDVVILGGAGLPLGMRSHTEPETTTVPLGAGDTLVLYTDGLSEVQRRPRDGEAAIVDAVRRGDVFFAPDPARTLYDRLVGARARDDVAILVASFGARAGAPVMRRRRAAVADESGVRAIRAEIEAELASANVHEAVRFRAHTVLAELIGNVARYAPGDVEVGLDLRRDTIVLHVLDRGPGFTYVARLPLDPYAEHGRGLFIARELADELTVSRRAQGGSHARAVLLTARI